MFEQIFIPTRGRIGIQDTYGSFTKEFIRKYNIKLVGPSHEAPMHRRLGYKVLRCDMEGIAKTRQWIMDYSIEKGLKRIIMCDDDHLFFVRKNQNAFNLRKATTEEIENIFIRMFKLCKVYPLVGLSARSGNNRFFPDKIKTCVRQNNIHAIDTKVFAKINARFDQTIVMEDFNVILTFLRNGHKNAIITDCAWDQMGTNAPGGCSLYRNNDIQKESAIKLKELHPDFVSIVEKKSKSGWKGMEVRRDVRIQWKRAFKSSRTPKRSSD